MLAVVAHDVAQQTSSTLKLVSPFWHSAGEIVPLSLIYEKLDHS
jgi:hypothetical protein